MCNKGVHLLVIRISMCLLDLCLNFLKHRFLANLTTLYLLHK